MKAIAASLLLWACLAALVRAQNPSQKIDRYLSAEERQEGLSGKVIVAEADTVLIDKNMAAPQATEMPHTFPVGSIAEQFAAAAALLLAKDGKLSLDQRLCEFISDCPASWNKIQIRHLITHSSGLPAVESVSACAEKTASAQANWELVKGISTKSLQFVPGGQFRDNPVDDVLLWRVIQKASGQSVPDYMETYIFHPLGLAHTQFSQPKPDEAVCTTHCISFEPQLYSTPEDLYRWQRALTTDALLSKSLRDQMFVAYVEGQGFGFKIIKEFDRKVGVQNSNCGPSSLSIRNYVDDGTFIVVWFPSDSRANQISHDIGSIIFGKHYPLNSNPSVR